MKQKKTKKSKVVKLKKKKLKKVATLAKGINVVEKSDGTYVISGKNAKALEGAVVERKERQYKFDDRLVPYFVGADSREGNLTIREALIKLGKTDEMTKLFDAIKIGNLDYSYDEQGTNFLVKALVSIIKGHNTIGLQHIYEEDIQAIEVNNRKTFDDFFSNKEQANKKDENFDGFSN